MLSQASQDHLPLPFPGCRWRRCKHHPTPPSMGRHGSLACGRQCEARCIGHPLSLLERLLLLALSLWLPQHHNCLKKSLSVGWLVECCFTSTETIGLLGTGAQDGHTAPELWSLSAHNYLFYTPFFLLWQSLLKRFLQYHLICNLMKRTDPSSFQYSDLPVLFSFTQSVASCPF